MDRRKFLASMTLTLVSVSSLAKPARPAPTVWKEFKDKFFRAGRIVDTGNDGISHSEGQGMGMLAAVWANDQAGFNALWEFTKENMQRPDGLLSWRWTPGKGVTDQNNASDGDLYVAWALYRAAIRWNQPALLKESETIRRALLRHCVVNTVAGPVLIPGKDGFVSQSDAGPKIIVNPSYWVFPALSQFAALEDGASWYKLKVTGLKVLNAARFGPKELPADWLVMGDPYMPWPERPARFSYDAIRVPLFLAWDKQTANLALKSCAQFMRTPGFAAWASLTDASSAHYRAPVGFEAVAKVVRQAVFQQPAVFGPIDQDYFSSSLCLLAQMAADDVQP